MTHPGPLLRALRQLQPLRVAQPPLLLLLPTGKPRERLKGEMRENSRTVLVRTLPGWLGDHICHEPLDSGRILSEQHYGIRYPRVLA